MIDVKAAAFKKDLLLILEQVRKNDEVVKVRTDQGNAIVMSEESYYGLQESVYLSSTSKMRKKIIEGMRTPLKNCVEEDKVNW